MCVIRVESANHRSPKVILGRRTADSPRRIQHILFIHAKQQTYLIRLLALLLGCFCSALVCNLVYYFSISKLL